MSKQDDLTKLARYSIKNPNFSPKGEPSPIENNDFTDATNDVSIGARTTLASYLGKKTGYGGESQINVYPVSLDEVLLEKPHVRGNSLTEPITSQDFYTKNSDAAKESLKSSGHGIEFDGSSQSPEKRIISFFTDSQINDVLSKTGRDSTKLGHTLLSGVPEKTTEPVGKVGQPSSRRPQGEGAGIRLLQAVHDQLRKGNMYSSDETQFNREPFLKSEGGGTEENSTRGLFTIQKNLGTFDLNGQRIQVSDMSSIAMSLLLRANGNFDAANILLQNKSLEGIATSALTPFLRPAQIGAQGIAASDYRLKFLKKLPNGTVIGVETTTGQSNFIVNLRSDPSTVTRGVMPQNTPELPLFQSTPNNAGSYAQMNTFLEPFSVGTRFSSVSMFMMSTAAMLTIILVCLGLGALLNKFGKVNKSSKFSIPTEDLQVPDSLPLGRRKNAEPDLVRQLLQITNTDYDFEDAVTIGIPLMFGISSPTASITAAISNPTTLLTIAENLALSGGFYANFTRRLIAEGSSIVNVFAKIGGSATEGVESFLKGIENLLDSPLYKFIMIAAGVGDIAMQSVLGVRSVSHNEKFVVKRASFDAYKTPGIIGEKLDGGGQIPTFRKQQYRWASIDDRWNGANSLSLKTFYSTQRKLPPGVLPNGMPKGNNRMLDPDENSRRKIEDALDAEYMPFYIHDMRTGEIMSMPAFITEFAETFTANYNSVEGIGRQDPVRLYQKTERGVTFGFMLVAYSSQDQDHLWWTINRLVSMCYPQYSKGRSRQTIPEKDGSFQTFIQPFSQVQAASPMVRLRLGDVFKSNYSRFGLMRLFGVGMNGGYTDTTRNVDEQKVALEQAEAAAADKYEESIKKNGFSVGTRIEFKKIGTAYGSKEGLNTDFLPNVKIVAGTEGVIVGVYSKELQLTSKNFKFLEKLGDPEISYQVQQIENYAGYTIYAKSSQILGPAEDARKKFIDADSDVINARKKLEAAQEKAQTVDNDPFSARNNAIVRSFNSSRGRGVAGFITTLGLDYGIGNYQWSIDPGSRAPMVVKISLGFAPITDLPLGLDYEGRMRNPSHPVGALAGSFGDPYYASLGDKAIDVNEVHKNIKTVNKSAEAEAKIVKDFTE